MDCYLSIYSIEILQSKNIEVGFAIILYDIKYLTFFLIGFIY